MTSVPPGQAPAVRRSRQREEQEITDLFSAYGLSSTESAPVVNALTLRPDRWRDFMMRFELGLERPDPRREVGPAELTLLGALFAESYVAFRGNDPPPEHKARGGENHVLFSAHLPPVGMHAASKLGACPRQRHLHAGTGDSLCGDDRALQPADDYIVGLDVEHSADCTTIRLESTGYEPRITYLPGDVSGWTDCQPDPEGFLNGPVHENPGGSTPHTGH